MVFGMCFGWWVLGSVFRTVLVGVYERVWFVEGYWYSCDLLRGMVVACCLVGVMLRGSVSGM